MAKEWMGTREAAKELKVTQRSVNRYIALGILPAKRAYPDGPWIIMVGDISKFAKPGEKRRAPSRR